MTTMKGVFAIPIYNFPLAVRYLGQADAFQTLFQILHGCLMRGVEFVLDLIWHVWSWVIRCVCPQQATA